MANTLRDETIIEVIEKGMSSLGATPSEAVWFYLEKGFHYERHKAPQDIEDFQQVLQKLFGMGYGFLDTLFRKHLTEATGKDLSACESLAACVKSLREEGQNESLRVSVTSEFSRVPFAKSGE